MFTQHTRILESLRYYALLEITVANERLEDSLRVSAEYEQPLLAYPMESNANVELENKTIVRQSWTFMQEPNIDQSDQITCQWCNE